MHRPDWWYLDRCVLARERLGPVTNGICDRLEREADEREAARVAARIARGAPADASLLDDYMAQCAE